MKKKLNCVNCGAPLHGDKCEYCGTEYDFDDIIHVKTSYIPLEDVVSIVKVSGERLLQQDAERFVAGYIKPAMAKKIGEELLNHGELVEYEEWFDPVTMEHTFGARVKVGIIRH